MPSSVSSVTQCAAVKIHVGAITVPVHNTESPSAKIPTNHGVDEAETLEPPRIAWAEPACARKRTIAATTAKTFAVNADPGRAAELNVFMDPPTSGRSARFKRMLTRPGRKCEQISGVN
jgi:hypothetical protein